MIYLKNFHSLALLLCLLSAVALASAQENPPAKPRARDLGVPFDGTPGPLNAITDVPGVTVGHTRLISGEGKLEVGKGPVRTGVTAVLPRGKDSMSSPVFAGWWSQRQRRNDRHHLGGRIRFPRWSRDDHQHAQRRRRARRRHSMARRARPARS